MSIYSPSSSPVAQNLLKMELGDQLACQAEILQRGIWVPLQLFLEGDNWI